MKRIIFLTSSVFLTIVLLLTTHCKPEHNSPEPLPHSNPILSHSDSVNLEINQFIWSGLHSYYLWVDSVSKLSANYFKNSEDTLNSFLLKYTDHEKLFNDLLYPNLDRWSWIVDDYTVLENELQGITKSFGFEFGLSLYGGANSDKVLGYVKYVNKNSPADIAGLKRGDLFLKVNGQYLTKSNYQSLLFNRDSYTLSLFYVSNNTLYFSRDASLSAVEMQENPVFLDTTYTVNSRKVGYLVYNGFYPDFDIQLNNAFKKLKDFGIQDLILDLRYNGGGSIQSAIYLASMIYSTDNKKVFVTSKYNTALQSYLLGKYGSNFFIDHFTDTIARDSNHSSPTQINSLGLSKLYVITTGNTASASELIINGLKPYINVVVIGTNSVGKYVGSITLKDWNSNGDVNPNHKWAMQPIILKLANKDGVSDYKNGFTPNVNVQEDLSNLLTLGNPNEPLLKAAIFDLLGYSQQSAILKSTSTFKDFADSKDFKPHGKEMYKNLGTRIRPGDLH